MSKRAGFSLAETLVVLVVLGVIGASMAQVLTVQSRFVQTQEGRSVARQSARNGANVALSELRRVHAGSGVVAASATSITFRVPFAIGILCGTDGDGKSHITLMPVDSASYNDPGFTGFAWRGSTGQYTYVTSSVLKENGGSPVICTGAVPSITQAPGSELVRVKPAIVAPSGTPVFLYREVRYDLAASVSVPGRLGLWRTVPSASLVEELVAPFDATARFRFFTTASPLAQDAVPSPLSNITGIELQLVSVNERGTGDLVPYTTGVFFKNRVVP